MEKLTAERIHQTSYSFINGKGYDKNHRYIKENEIGFKELKIGKTYSVTETCTGETYELQVLAQKGYEYKTYLI